MKTIRTQVTVKEFYDFFGEMPKKDNKSIFDYCTQNQGDCSTCSLVNYGRDCRNNPVEK